MAQHPTAEDLYIGGLLLQHRILSEDGLEAVRLKAASNPGMSMSDIFVEAGYLTFQQRKALATLLQRTDDVGEVLAGRMAPTSLLRVPAAKSSVGSKPGAAKATGRDAHLDDTFQAPEGVPRDQAATRLYSSAEEESEAFGAPGAADRPGEMTFHGADTQMLAPQEMRSELPTLRPDELERGADRRDGVPRDQAATLRGADLANTLREGEDDDDTSIAATLTDRADRRAASLHDTGDASARNQATTGGGNLSRTEPDMIRTSDSPDFGATKPSVEGPAFAIAAANPSIAGGILADTGIADLLTEEEASGLDLSSMLSAEEISRLKASAQEGTSPLLGHKLGGYVVIDKLGEGGMGEVYLAKQLSLNRYVALKVLPRNLSRDPRFVERFIHEANMLARVNHSNVVKVYDVARAGDLLYITMENIRGESLRDLIERSGQVPLAAAVNIIKQVCRALGRVKKEGIIHRDIKPGNILLDEGGEVKVVDFGLADLHASIAEQTSGHTAGTPYYIPPESIRNEPATHLSDQYSLGATFYHMIIGRPPYKGASLQATLDLHVNAPVPHPSDADSALPHEIDDVIGKMMAKDPHGRYRTFREVFEALEKVEMKLGLTDARQEFLDEGLIGLRSANIRHLKANIAWWSFVAVCFTYAGIGLNLFLRGTLDGASAGFLVDLAGNWGTYLVLSAYLIILYVGMVRKRWAPAVWSVRRWIQVHIGMALVGSFLVMVHSGNFLRDYLALTPADRAMVKPVALLPLFNTLALMLVVASGLIGRYIYRDLQRQAALETMMDVAPGEDEERTPPSRLALILISQRVMSFWRIVHYPLTIVFIILTFAHVLTVMYYGGSLAAVHPMEGWFPPSR